MICMLGGHGGIKNFPSVVIGSPPIVMFIPSFLIAFCFLGCGILDLLDEESKLPCPTFDHFTNAVHQQNKVVYL